VGASDPDDEADPLAFRAPLPQDDRLWRHPSELDATPRRSLWRRLVHLVVR
jgi:hypothetical protein